VEATPLDQVDLREVVAESRLGVSYDVSAIYDVTFFLHRLLTSVPLSPVLHRYPRSTGYQLTPLRGGTSLYSAIRPITRHDYRIVNSLYYRGFKSTYYTNTTTTIHRYNQNHTCSTLTPCYTSKTYDANQKRREEEQNTSGRGRS
jgi:hypothetical protein